MKNLARFLMMTIVVATLSMGLFGCSGDDGKDGKNFDPTVAAAMQAQIDDLEVQLANATTKEEAAALQAEIDALKAQLGGIAFVPGGDQAVSSCGYCHQSTGDAHQAEYDRYADASVLDLTIDSVVSTPVAEGYDVTMTFTVTKSGAPYVDADGLPGLDQKRFYTVMYDSATRMFTGSQSFGDIVALGGGQYAASAKGASYAPELSNAIAYGYVGQGKLMTEGMQLYDNIDNQGAAFGDANAYESGAIVSGCERCHGAPYMKHGYRAAAVDGLSDFAACKTCHYDNRNGGHQDWQILANDPVRYAEIHEGSKLTDAEKTKYAYTANVMNDTHMSHAMEFPYPQSMANCIVCHDGKLDMVLTDANFKLSTCKSCHPVDGTEAMAPALAPILANAEYNHGGIDLWNPAQTCNGCHNANTLPNFVFSKIHTGYNDEIYDGGNGFKKYSEGIVVTVNSATIDPTYNSVTFTGMVVTDPIYNAASVELSGVYGGLYGYDTKDLLVARVYGTTASDYITKVNKNKIYWTASVDFTSSAALIDGGDVNRASLVMYGKYVNADGDQVALDAAQKVLSLKDGKFGADPNIVDVKKCNACHDALATTFHSPDRGGSIETCKVCHAVTSPGSHLEMQGRSLDSYVHAIHSFQDFDIADIDFSDPVEAMRYDLHISHVYPNFTIMNCESCHTAGTFNPPSYADSLPGELSGSDPTPEGWNRNIGYIPARLVDPATRTCGACHRAQAIKADDPNALKALYDHNATNGYGEEGGDFDALVASVYAWFKSWAD